LHIFGYLIIGHDIRTWTRIEKYLLIKQI